MWREVRGKHWIGTGNEAEECFLEFCSSNNLTIMNTLFENKQAHLKAWTHPGTKQVHTYFDVRVYRNVCLLV